MRAAALALLLVLTPVACAQKPEGNAKVVADFAAQEGVVTTKSGLMYRVIKPGSGRAATKKDTVVANYTGRLLNGKIFDSSEGRDPIVGKPGNFIPGWGEALTLMGEGARWEIFIPAKLAYGAEGAGSDIPPNSPLIFDMEVIKVLSDADIAKLEAEYNKRQEQLMSEQTGYLEHNAKQPGVTVTASGLQYRVLNAGAEGGKSPKGGEMVTVHYEGKLVNGTTFDSSYARGNPATFPSDRLIKGWVEALRLMKEGDEWELVIPAAIGYGANGAGGAIPPHATLIFKVQLIKVG